ncbi:hypothetical protein C0033_14080 [Clostridium sp. chh4-2]|uniref:glycoside hydrolase family 32 protein n=1 Tax=Clostridium sp. chh4-2 TaxID=2067550 RepID=UPI000CCE9EC8|nr:GH32 C-terminal domain-containing protein [Clostridium sp. chh4-2]PNV61417.1 hypothetical protein C0033_14080 [Clostridium sp. chh4-2]
MYLLKTDKYSELIWIISQNTGDGLVEIYKDYDLIFLKRYTSDQPWYDRIRLEKNGTYKIFCNSIDIHFAYLCKNQDVLEHGVCFLEFQNEEIYKYDETNMDQAYGQTYRNAFHFSTYKNWMNDPNGLCFHEGRYHLFYQMNPAGMAWGNMYWGHACSRDLIHWTHLPIALFPQRELYGLKNYKGGAYSGSAWPEKHKIFLYFTRHFSPWNKGPQTKEVQMQAVCEDGVTVDQEQVIIADKPGGNRDFNFRDPKIVRIGQEKCILIGTTVNGTCTVEKYVQRQGKWTDWGPFFQDDTKCETMECVNLIRGENQRYALLCSLQNAVDPMGRKRLMKYYVGEIVKGKFVPQEEGIYDFGTECYAVQTFEAGIRNLAFGWVVSAYGEFKEEGSGSNGCMTIPRELIVREGRLITRPAEEIRQLLHHKTMVIKGGRVNEQPPERSNGYHLNLKIRNRTSFQIILAQNEERWIGVRYEGDQLGLLYGKKGIQTEPELNVTVETVIQLEIFVDKSVVELYVNDGEKVGTKTYFFKPQNKKIEYWFEKREEVEELAVSQINSIWKNGGMKE